MLMHLSLGPNRTLSDGFTSFNASAENALLTWNNYMAHLKFSIDRPSSLPPASDDADSSALFSSSVFGKSFGSGVLALTTRSYRDSGVTEADVVFNSAYTWDSYRGALRPGVIDFHRVALHEFGHVLGLDHPDEHSQNVIAIMNSRVSNIETLQTDDIAGARTLYSFGPAYLTATSSPNLVNLSTRGTTGLGENVMIGGFVIQGSQPASLVVRAVGHSLAAHGITNALPDPTIEIHDSRGIIQSSDDWVDSTNARTIASYRLDPPNSRESAVYVQLAPGAYTAIVRDFEPTVTGTALVEVYDLHKTDARAINISTRANVGTGNNVMIGGFVVGAGAAKTVVVRALGPTVGDNGVVQFLADPTVELRNAAGTLIASNDDWGQSANAAAIRSENLAPKYPAESALQTTLAGGASYTAIVRGLNGTTGVALVEVYDLNPAP